MVLGTSWCRVICPILTICPLLQEEGRRKVEKGSRNERGDMGPSSCPRERAWIFGDALKVKNHPQLGYLPTLSSRALSSISLHSFHPVTNGCQRLHPNRTQNYCYRSQLRRTRKRIEQRRPNLPFLLSQTHLLLYHRRSIDRDPRGV